MTALFFLLSLDSLFASLLLGVSRVEPARQRKLVLAFGACDGIASFIGGTLGPPGAHISWFASHQFHVVVGVYLAAVFLTWVLNATKSIGSPLLWTIPVILSIDNLVAPAAVPVTLPAVVIIALASASMSLIGFRVGTLSAALARCLASQRMVLRRSIP